MKFHLRKILPVGLLAVLVLVTAAAAYAETSTEPQTNDDLVVFRYSQSGVACDLAPCDVDVLNNDLPAGPWKASTLRIVDPGDLTTLRTKYVESDQGIWEVEPSRTGGSALRLVRAMEHPIRNVSGAYTDTPYPIDYVVEDDAQTLSNPSIGAITFTDSNPLSESLAIFPASLSLA